MVFARVAELVDALDSKSSFRKKVRVRFPPRVQLKIQIETKALKINDLGAFSFSGKA